MPAKTWKLVPRQQAVDSGIKILTGDFVFTDKPERFDLLGDGYSPVGMLAYNNNKQISNRLFGKFFVEIAPFKDLKFTSNMGVDFTSGNQRRFDRNWGTGNRINNPNQLTVVDGRFQTLTFSNFASQAAFLLWQTGHKDFQPQ